MSKANPINIRLIDHVVVRVNNLDSMVAFYRDVLGCRLERGPGEGGLAQLRAGESLIDLVDAKGPIGSKYGGLPQPDARNMDHFCLQITPWDGEAILAHLRHHKVEVGDILQLYGASGFGPSLYISDPEGNTVELKGQNPG
ncbi:MAG: VOC family protein [Pseudomonadota bacterium]